jgi:hypothetical protein
MIDPHGFPSVVLKEIRSFIETKLFLWIRILKLTAKSEALAC